MSEHSRLLFKNQIELCKSIGINPEVVTYINIESDISKNITYVTIKISLESVQLLGLINTRIEDLS